MALGQGPEGQQARPDWREPAASIADAVTLGDGLRAAREASGRSLGELSMATRVHSRYLIALEQADWAALPSRVFTLGYVRAYASALGLDEQLAVERYKREAPDSSVTLQPPTGAAFQEVKRQSPRVLGVALALVLAVVGWNVFQRVSMLKAPSPSDIAKVPESWSLGAVPGQSGGFTRIEIGTPLPAPPDQTVPALYVTPGLEAELTGVDPGTAVAGAAVDTPVQAAFNPRGAIYGAASSATQVVIQARKAAGLVVRMSDGRVLFARQLAAGEAWRAPLNVAATIDASEPAAFDVYLNGEHGGVLEAVLTPLGQLNARAQSLARQTAAQASAQAERLQAARAAAAARATAAMAEAAPASASPEVSPPSIIPAG